MAATVTVRWRVGEEVRTGGLDDLAAVRAAGDVVMKRLTAVATIFMPLTLITGIYGMNLTRGMWPSPDRAWPFAAVTGSFLVITVGMLYLFKRRGRW
jgi:magnesium transporter